MGEWIFDTPEAVIRVAASRVVQVVRQAVQARGVCAVALPGGGSPLALFARLVQPPQVGEIPWEQVHLFWGDERCVPLDDPRSNAGQAKRLCEGGFTPPAANVHRIQGELGPDEAARQYDALLREFFQTSGDEPPVFDLVILGMGADGHTASLYPGDAALNETRRWAVGVCPPPQADPPVARVSLTLPVFNSARQALFFVMGQGKRQALQRVRAGDKSLPAALIQPAKEPVWILDEAIAKQ